jgi:hypothetical protein
MIEHKPLYQAMIHAVSQTLENMAFMEVTEHPDKAYQIATEELAWTSLLIHDPVQGELRLAMPEPLLRTLTGNIFGQDEEVVTPAQQTDILNELLNTIAGLFMTSLLATDQEYKLGLPELGKGELPEPDADTLVWKLVTSEDVPLQLYAVGASLLALKNDC